MAIGDRIIRQTGKIIHAVHIFSPVPYDWDFERNRAVFKSSWLRHWCFVGATAAGIAYDAFSLYGSYKAWSNEALSESAKIGIYSLSYRFVMFTLMNFAVIQNYRCNHHLVNTFLGIIGRFKDEIGFAPPGKVFLVIIVMFRFNYFLNLSGARAVFSDPGNYRLLTSLAEDPKKLSTGVKILFFLVHLELQAIKVGMTIFITASLLGYMAFGKNMIDRFRIHGQNHTSEMPALSYLDIYRKYNQLRIVQKLFNQALSDWFLISTAYITLMIVLCIFQAVVFAKANFALLGVILLTLELSIVKMNGAMYEVSQEVQQSWTTLDAPVWFHKWRKSLQPLRVKMGAVGFFDRGLRLTVLDIILTNSVNLIITHSK